MKEIEEMLSQLHVILDRLNGLTVSDIKGREKILRMIMTIIDSIIDSNSEPTDMVDKVKGELKSFKEKEQEAQHVITDHQGVKGTWEVFLKEQTDRLGQSTVETVKATFDPQEALAILSRGNANEIEEKLGISTEEERELVKEKLGKSLPMIGQLTQMSFLKDLMNLSHKYAAEKGKAEEIVEELAPRLTSETPEQRKYRLAVVSILTKFESWEVFNKLFSKAFDARVLTAIHTFYEAKDTTARSTAVYALINTENFPKEMAHLAQHMAEINQFMHIDDLAECVQKQRELIKLSGDTAVKSSEFNTISFGDAYLVHLMYKSAMNVNVIKYFEYDTGFHNEAGESITYDIALPPETIRQWADKGWLDKATREGLVALFGGQMSNTLKDIFGDENDPTTPEPKQKK